MTQSNAENTSMAMKAQASERKGFQPLIPIPKTIVHNFQPVNYSKTSTNSEQRVQNLYKEYLGLLQEEKSIKLKMEQVQRENRELQEKIHNLQSYQPSEKDNSKKRHRRQANEIHRSFACPTSGCQKSYGSEGSLVQHIKNKHRPFYQSVEYEAAMAALHKQDTSNN